ncbi:MAG: thioredoxin family protein [Bacteroidales bacterium]|nr:MAG: thioredoxin family protein [Bacteroidales bacterium]
MKNEIKILCPARKCSKCRRMIARAEEAVNNDDQGISIVIEDSLNEILKYPTWILPTMVINGKVVARGYVPSLDKIRKTLKYTL